MLRAHTETAPSAVLLTIVMQRVSLGETPQGRVTVSARWTGSQGGLEGAGTNHDGRWGEGAVSLGAADRQICRQQW